MLRRLFSTRSHAVTAPTSGDLNNGIRRANTSPLYSYTARFKLLTKDEGERKNEELGFLKFMRYSKAFGHQGRSYTNNLDIVCYVVRPAKQSHFPSILFPCTEF